MFIAEKADRILEQAKSWAGSATSWTEFSNRLFSQDDGLVAKTFPRMTERQQFYDSVQYGKVNELLLSLIKRFGVADGAAPMKSGKFVVRVPKSLHQVLEVEAGAEGISLNQLALTKLSIRLKDSTDLTRSLIVEAYKQVHDGYSCDRVIVDPVYNRRFLEQCRKVGLTQSDYELNHSLMGIRKSGKAVLPPATKKPQIPDYDGYLFASEIAFRYLQQREGVALDTVLCDPQLRERFDEIAGRLAPNYSPFKLRMGALYLRKTHKLKPEVVDGPLYDFVRAGRIGDVNLSDLPELPGAYGFYENVRPIYAGETNMLRHRIKLHLQHSGQMFLPQWLELGFEANLELRFFAFPEFSSKDDRVRWLMQFINKEKPTLNYQIAA